MSRIAVVTDSAAAIAPGVARSLEETGGFAVVPMPVTVHSSGGLGRELDGMSEQKVDEAILMAHIQGETVSTSGPAPGAFAQTYRDFAAQGYTHILSVHLSGALSGTAGAARAGARLAQVPVTVIDSRTVAGAYGYAVQRAHELAQTLTDPHLLAQLTRDMCADTEVFFYIPTLEALRRGGRVSPALAMVGQMFQIKPIGTVSDGKLVYVERPRTAVRAKQRLVEITQDACGTHRLAGRTRSGAAARCGIYPTGQVVAVHHCGNVHEAEQLRAALGSVADQAITSSLPPVLAAHSGLGALAAIVY